ncbi:unnamed protein product [Staurois parvus]|uniref:Uncharacterized protein n=1 Tax=Staurois parvus TaxID=386267 RepID=A0ABN9DZB6_9NEOB|nr:unnamed protein product [Staurois parvus]
MLKRTVRRSRQLSAESIAKTSKIHVAFRLAQQQCTESFMEWVSMGKQLHPSLTSPSAMQSVGCFTPLGSGDENGTCLTALCQV